MGNARSFWALHIKNQGILIIAIHQRPFFFFCGAHLLPSSNKETLRCLEDEA